jgi:transketolase
MFTTEILAKRLRIHAVKMTNAGKSSHIGSILSMIDILAVLYGDILLIDPDNPKLLNRDRFILSKGHAGAGVYAALAERGFFSIEKLAGHYQDGSYLSGHVSHKNIPGVEVSTGSLGHGLPIGAGMALAAKRDGKLHRIFVILSDGECDEGSNWEAILFASHHKLDNLVVIVDYNKLQSLASPAETLNLEPFNDKWKAFGWNVIEVNGHDHEQIKLAFAKANHVISKPTCIIAHTTKGKGVSFMEDQVLWHYRSPQGDEFSAALTELESADYA